MVTPHKNLWHCFSCQLGGGPIDWVMKAEGVSFRHAVELLEGDARPSRRRGGSGQTEHRAADCRRRCAFDADDQVAAEPGGGLLSRDPEDSPEALAYLKARGLDHPEAIERFQLGYANRTLGYGLPE